VGPCGGASGLWGRLRASRLWGRLRTRDADCINPNSTDIHRLRSALVVAVARRLHYRIRRQLASQLLNNLNKIGIFFRQIKLLIKPTADSRA